MSITYSEREKAINELFDYEETYNIPEDKRLTEDAYAGIPSIPELSPRKKPYVDIRAVIRVVKDLKNKNLIK